MSRTYRRPVSGAWWTRNPFYLAYMAREVSSVFIVAYALVLLWGLLRLSQGKAAFEAWQASLAGPVAMGFHVVALVLVTYHAWTWFKVMPKTMPHVPVSDRAIVAMACTASAVASLALFVTARWFGLWAI